MRVPPPSLEKSPLECPHIFLFKATIENGGFNSTSPEGPLEATRGVAASMFEFYQNLIKTDFNDRSILLLEKTINCKDVDSCLSQISTDTHTLLTIELSCF